MTDNEIQRTFRQNPLQTPIGLIFVVVFAWFGIQGLLGDKCPSAPWISYVFSMPAILIASSILVGIILYSDTDLSLSAGPKSLCITSRWFKLYDSQEFARNEIRSISIVPTVSEGVPATDSYYLITDIWMSEPFRISPALKKSDAIKFAQSLADMYEVSINDLTGEVITSDFPSCDAASAHTKRFFKKLLKKK